MGQDALPPEICTGWVKVSFLRCPIDSSGIFLRPLVRHGSADTLVPPVQLLHLLYGVGPLQHLGGRGRCRPLPRGGSVDVIHVEDSAVAVDARLPVWRESLVHPLVAADVLAHRWQRSQWLVAVGLRT